jgi:MFS transporter
VDGESVNQPVQHRRRRLDIDARRGEPGPAQPSNQTSTDLPNDLIALVQNLSDPSISRRLGNERDGDLHLQASFGIEGKELLDDGENERTRFGLGKMALDADPGTPPHQLRGVHEQLRFAGEDVPDRTGGDSGFRGDGANGDAADALGVNHSPSRLCDLLPAPVAIDELGHSTRLRPMLVAVVATMTAETAISLLLMLHLQRGFRLEVIQIAYVFLPGAVAMSILPSHLHRLVVRFGRRRMLVVGAVSSALFAASLALAPTPPWIAALWVLSAIAWSIGPLSYRGTRPGPCSPRSPGRS